MPALHSPNGRVPGGVPSQNLLVVKMLASFASMTSGKLSIRSVGRWKGSRRTRLSLYSPKPTSV